MHPEQPSGGIAAHADSDGDEACQVNAMDRIARNNITFLVFLILRPLQFGCSGPHPPFVLIVH